VTVESLLKKYKDKSFAKGANREAIGSIDSLGLSLEEFMKIGLNSLQAIAKELGM
jgi:predicted hydrolase (HD superfamily)